MGTIVASIKDRDGPHDRAANLSRDGVYRFAFQLSEHDYVERFGSVLRARGRDGRSTFAASM